MSETYKRVDASHYRNIWVVGDLHGCYQNLMGQLVNVGFDVVNDLLISVGDLIDRGTQNIECLDLINNPWFMAVRGNHEQMAIDAITGRNPQHWISNGGGWFYCLDAEQSLLAESLIRKADSLPFIIEVDTDKGKYVIAHADYPDSEYQFGKEVSNQQIIWNRERISDSIDGLELEIKGADKFIFGHTAVNRVTNFKNQMYIDTGAVFTGRLTLLQIQGEQHKRMP